MENWVIWLSLAGVLVLAELFSASFYLLMIAIGFFAGGLLALAGLALPVQLIGAALVASLASYALHKSRFGMKKSGKAEENPNVHPDIGQILEVDSWQQQGEIATARAKYRGALWDIEMAHKEAKKGRFVIGEVRGNVLIVKEVS